MPQHGVIMKCTSFETDTGKALLFPSSNSSQTYSLHQQTGKKTNISLKKVCHYLAILLKANIFVTELA